MDEGWKVGLENCGHFFIALLKIYFKNAKEYSSPLYQFVKVVHSIKKFMNVFVLLLNRKNASWIQPCFTFLI